MKLTADHTEIRRWIEERGGSPRLESAGQGRERLCVSFAEDDGRRVSWEEFFERFDRESLAFAYDPDASGEGVVSAKLVSR
ncbi:MAG TPA: hypothetical protein VD790_11045 [Thermoleophilaceae bacterium]|nr:hypothetical protein [Thermoleophilaceae bacterium]